MKKTSNEEKPTMSQEMLHNCKNDIAHYGFFGREYEAFLNSVCAMKGLSVLKFPNSQIEEYRKRFLRTKENSISDAFVFDQISKIKNDNESGYPVETGWFCPRSFWDAVLRMR